MYSLGSLARVPQRRRWSGLCRSSKSGHLLRANNFLQFLDRIDGRGGFAVVETEDPTLIARDTAIFGAFLDFSVYPVLDSEEWAGIAVEAVEFRRSAS